MVNKLGKTGLKKKRGRKPKGKIIDYNKQKLIKENSEEIPIIAHLDINLNEKLSEDFSESEKNTESIFIKNENNLNLNTKLKELETEIENLKNNTSINEENNNLKEYHNVKCWYCRNSFQEHPVRLPENYFKGKFICTGNFCSYNCAMSFNIDLNDEKTSVRNSLINMLYQKTYETDELIKPAPSWKILKEYGGVLTIEEFRNNLNKNNDDYIYLHPPLISSVSQISKQTSKKKISAPMSDIEKYMSNTNELVLKRSKPLKTSRYSLENTMGLKIKKKKRNKS
jgi:hypothetical protein